MQLLAATPRRSLVQAHFRAPHLSTSAESVSQKAQHWVGTRTNGTPRQQKRKVLRLLPVKDICAIYRASEVEMLCSRKPKAAFELALAEAQAQKGITRSARAVRVNISDCREGLTRRSYRNCVDFSSQISGPGSILISPMR